MKFTARSGESFNIDPKRVTRRMEKTKEGKDSMSPIEINREQAKRSMEMNRGKTPPGDNMTPMPRRRPSAMDNYKGYPMPEKRPKK